jgi:thiol-disulfide isomerase/thioredoxin
MMNVEPEVSTEGVAISPQASVAASLDHAATLEYHGKLPEAASELESALSRARATPYEIEFLTRIRLGMTLSDVYLSLDQTQKASSLLADEAAFAQRIAEIMQATGTPDQKRAATAGYLQMRDRATQVALIGQTAPEISVKTWINGDPVTLTDLRGRVALLEFWATWCKPCQEMFPKLKQLHEEAASRGLEIIAITRHYLAYRGTEDAMQDELRLMGGTVTEHGVSFPVGVAEDERLQAIYGANGLPTAILIDRQGLVRYAGPGGEDRGFDAILQKCLSESA